MQEMRWHNINFSYFLCSADCRKQLLVSMFLTMENSAAKASQGGRFPKGRGLSLRQFSKSAEACPMEVAPFTDAKG